MLSQLNTIEQLSKAMSSLENKHIGAMQKATDSMDIAVAAKDEAVEYGVACRQKILNMTEELNNLRASNLDLTLKNILLQQEVDLAKREVLVVH